MLIILWRVLTEFFYPINELHAGDKIHHPLKLQFLSLRLLSKHKAPDLDDSLIIGISTVWSLLINIITFCDYYNNMPQKQKSQSKTVNNFFNFEIVFIWKRIYSFPFEIYFILERIYFIYSVITFNVRSICVFTFAIKIYFNKVTFMKNGKAHEQITRNTHVGEFLLTSLMRDSTKPDLLCCAGCVIFAYVF